VGWPESRPEWSKESEVSDRNELKSAGFVRKLGNIIEELERIGEKELIERCIGGESEIAKLRLRGWEFERWAM
jgi:hypothetical protein